MKVITYSDLHLEFGEGFTIPFDCGADVVILAGDVITFRDYEPLKDTLADWNGPVLYVAGNHEYYRSAPIREANAGFREWLSENILSAIFLDDESVEIGGVHFFGGTMWTDFTGGNPLAMMTAEQQMNDYRCIRVEAGTALKPQDTIKMHQAFVEKLQRWFEKDLPGPRVVITHHAPVVNPQTQYGNSPLMPAFNSLDMLPLIEKYQPDLWVYGHTHECDDQTIGKTRIISNQRGYPNRGGNFECRGFDPTGVPVEV